jgi:DNA repair protein RadC
VNSLPGYSVSEARTLKYAQNILKKRIISEESVFTSPTRVKEYIQFRLAPYEHEVFGVLFLTTKHTLITFEELFHGTIDGASVYPREIVKRALAHNAAAVILSHNHPSGSTEPSRDDQTITQQIKDALKLVDVRVLDHILVSVAGTTSFAEMGLI